MQSSLGAVERSGGLDGLWEGCFYRSRHVIRLEPQGTLGAVSLETEKVNLCESVDEINLLGA